MLFALHYIHKWKLHCVSIWKAGDGVGRETKSLSLSRFLMMLYHSAKRLTHLACHLYTESDLSTYWMCPLLKPEWKSAACYPSDCVFVSFLNMWDGCECMWLSLLSLSVNFNPLTWLVWWTHSSHTHVLWRRTDGGGGHVDAAFWSHLTSTATAHLAHAPWS